MIHLFPYHSILIGLIIALEWYVRHSTLFFNQFQLSLLKYALSAETSSISKFLVVSLTNALSSGLSLSNSDVILTEVIIFDFTPVIKWHLTHLLELISLPYLKLYHL